MSTCNKVASEDAPSYAANTVSDEERLILAQAVVAADGHPVGAQGVDHDMRREACPLRKRGLGLGGEALALAQAFLEPVEHGGSLGRGGRYGAADRAATSLSTGQATAS